VLGELGESLRAVVQGTKEAVGCDAVVLYVYDQDRGKLEHPPTMEGVRFPDKVRRGTEVPPRSIVYTMLRKNKLYIVERVAKDRLFSVTRFALEEEIESLVAIPLKAAAQKVGVMFVNYRTRHRFTEDELTNLELFSNQAAVAIQNAQLYHRSQRWAEVQEALYRASRIITGSLDLQEVIGHVAQQTWEVGSKPGEERALFSGVSLMEDGILTDVAAYPPESFEVFASMAAGIKLSPKAGQRIGILGRAVATRKSQVVGDVTRDPDYIEVDPRTRSELAVPLLVGREVIGAVILEHAEPDAFGSEEFIALSSLAAQAGLAIQHARLYQAERRHAQALESIQATSSAVSAILDLEELLPMITEEAAGIFSAPASSLMLWDERHESLVIRAACGLGDRYRQEQRIARSTVDRLIETRGLRPHVFDIAQEPLGRPDLIEEEQLRRALVAPLVKGEVLIGILCVYDREVPCPFSDKEQELARVFASHAAIAIQNAQLYDEISERAAVLQTLYEAGKAITSTLTPDEILNQIVKQALNLTRSQGQPTHFGHLALVEGNRIRFVAADTPQILEQLRKQVGEIDLHRTHQVGIVGRVAKTGIAQNVHDVSRHPDYILLRSSTHSQLSVPIVIGDRVIGVISAEHPECDAFDQEDQEALEHLAAQAAVAIQNARLYEQARIVADISREAARQLELTAFLETLFARLKLVFQERRIPVYLNLDTYDKDTNSLIPNPTAFYPAERPKVIPLTDSSLMAWVAETRKPYYAPDVSQDRRYHLRLPDTCSEFAVPVCFGDGLLGVLNLESPLRNAFTPEDQQLVRTLSDQVATTIHNVQQYEELRRIKGFVGSQTALEWMRMVSTAWGHSIKREVGTALASAGLLEQGIKKREQQRAIDELGDLKEILRKIGEIPLTAPLSAEDQVTPVRVNQTIEAYLRRLQGHPRHSLVSITHNLQPDLDDIVTVIASEGWLRRGLEIVVENAIQAMLDSDSDPKLLTVTTHLQDDWVQILVQDTGPGIPGEIRRKLFKERIPRSEGSLGAGIGLLLAKAIFETYQGRIEVLDCEPPGALLSILLPAERGV
jgi:GAF domain-containing protein